MGTEPGDDCDDSDETIYWGATDTWYDGIDSDCDGADDYDMDGDGHAHEDHGGGDCDDTDPAINPDAEDIPDDGIDHDCDGEDGVTGFTGETGTTWSSVPAPSGMRGLQDYHPNDTPWFYAGNGSNFARLDPDAGTYETLAAPPGSLAYCCLLYTSPSPRDS